MRHFPEKFENRLLGPTKVHLFPGALACKRRGEATAKFKFARQRLRTRNARMAPSLLGALGGLCCWCRVKVPAHVQPFAVT